ncbi:MAG: rRNA maturation RNase YbeY [Caldilineales bacterium]|nr:rRNA maturation RNase YbeY [Caldilineales bacterium]
MAIELDIDDEFEALVSSPRLERAINRALEYEQIEGDITVVVTNDAEIAELNQRFLGHSGPTDVLSFPAFTDEEHKFSLPPGFAPYLGDIVIAYPYSARQAEERGGAIADELDLLVVHGVLHLLGYDHAETEEEAVMWARQEAILASLRAG